MILERSEDAQYHIPQCRAHLTWNRTSGQQKLAFSIYSQHPVGHSALTYQIQFYVILEIERIYLVVRTVLHCYVVLYKFLKDIMVKIYHGYWL